jgi:hypothetical protein
MIVAYFWTIKPSRIANAIVAMGFDRFFLMADKNVSFHKSLGTGKGETFTPSDASGLPSLRAVSSAMRRSLSIKSAGTSSRLT